MATALRKVAILVDSLDSRTADALLDQLDERQAARVRGAVMELKRVASGERHQIIAEFLSADPFSRQASAGEAHDAGVEIDISPGARMAESPQRRPGARPPAAPESGGVVSPAAESPRHGFALVADSDAIVLGGFLESEHPQTAAVVLSQMPPAQAALVLPRLSPRQQAMTMRRIADLGDTPADAVEEIRRQVEFVLAGRVEPWRPAAAEAGADSILAALDKPGRAALISHLEQFEPALAEQLDPSGETAAAAARQLPNRPEVAPPAAPKPDDAIPDRMRGPSDASSAPRVRDSADEAATPVEPVLSFADLALFDDGGLAEVLRASDPKAVMPALAGADRSLIDRMLRRLPRKEAKAVRRALGGIGPLRLSDVDEAQRQVARVATELLQSGCIQLTQPRRRAA